jgi:hypothetical protein
VIPWSVRILLKQETREASLDVLRGSSLLFVFETLLSHVGWIFFKMSGAVIANIDCDYGRGVSYDLRIVMKSSINAPRLDINVGRRTRWKRRFPIPVTANASIGRTIGTGECKGDHL